MDNSLTRNNEMVEIIFAALSLVSSLSVVVTGVIFGEMRKRLFMHIIFFLSVADMFASCFALLGYPAQGTIACSLQGFGISYFVKACLFWNVMLFYQLYTMVMSNRVALSIPSMHMIVWPLAALIALLPLCTSSFGRSNTNETVQWCFLHENRTSLWILWNIYDWIGVVVLTNLWMAFLSRQVRLRLIRGVDEKMSQASLEASQQIFYSLFLFPFVLFVTYFPLVFLNAFMFFVSAPTRQYNPDNILIKLGTQQQWLCVANDLALGYGISLSFIFYWKSPEARNRWKKLIREKLGLTRDDRFQRIDLDFDENPLLQTTAHTTGGVKSVVSSGSGRTLCSQASRERSKSSTINVGITFSVDSGSSHYRSQTNSRAHSMSQQPIGQSIASRSEAGFDVSMGGFDMTALNHTNHGDMFSIYEEEEFGVITRDISDLGNAVPVAIDTPADGSSSSQNSQSAETMNPVLNDSSV